MQGAGAGVEIALLDIKGKALGVPMHELLGGKIRDRIRMYCDCHSGAFWTAEDYARRWREVRKTDVLDAVYEPSAYVEQAKRVVAEGFTACLPSAVSPAKRQFLNPVSGASVTFTGRQPGHWGVGGFGYWGKIRCSTHACEAHRLTPRRSRVSSAGAFLPVFCKKVGVKWKIASLKIR